MWSGSRSTLKPGTSSPGRRPAVVISPGFVQREGLDSPLLLPDHEPGQRLPVRGRFGLPELAVSGVVSLGPG